MSEPVAKPPKKERPPRQKMPEQPADVRVHNFDEVPFGLTPEQAQLEASRCLQCKKPPCVTGCPVCIDIPGFIKHIAAGDFDAAIRKLKEQTTLPAVCGRVCPQEDQCEKFCVLGKKGDPVAIGYLERFAADYEMRQGQTVIPEIAPPTGKRVAIVGAGPAGITAAFELAKLGHKVTMFEAFHKAGGVLVYGIPEFRLPKAIVQRNVDTLLKMGVEILTNYVVGKLDTVDELLSNGYHAVFIGTGAGLPHFLDIPGEQFNGVLSANEFLTRTNLMKAYRSDHDTPVRRAKRAVVFGGGNVAMDSARTALRLGAEEVYILYRRTKAEMPARIEEVHHAVDEGVRFEFLVAPIEILGDDKGWVRAVRCIRMKLGEPDKSGRPRPVPIEGSEFEFPCDQIIVAIGNGPNPLVPATTPDLATSRWGNIVADEATGQTSKPGVFAGGDIVTGAATVIKAMGAGKAAARAIQQYLVSSPR
ncbi:MAG TPA: NADPH-dependent glutamate synthase [Planctomycetota bacterium]|nr:NADPH-dependent glutamate synthase [Planctomycetota bacterium]HRR80753.1 NADPH-dependent glutamate synthase [Planctomycetota bacterium]HRT97818.1 NADPH-dependent glutamate synthase [Planctomycetota bacterium]